MKFNGCFKEDNLAWINLIYAKQMIRRYIKLTITDPNSIKII